ncbi:hypothetical protein PsAD5_01586 [Pseudovibrio sp. Ad5]|uniref:hypothetical protein n=1 Tax=Pseudovibrio sp. Ad5 TaxID=989436 RepID=UPI0007AE3F7D|nr:hypothetical protein [Pseudovibrio sp. Ad5]KZK98963.1 hypothetical protein PsAD5_01586 [Pseudovibrio sp. Ad5]
MNKMILKHSAKATLSAVAILSCALLVSCNPLPEVSDDQLTALFGDKGWNFNSDLQPLISESTEQCVMLMAGLDVPIYAGLDGTLISQVTLECRKDLQKRLSDPERNSTELELKHFENAELARRIIDLRASLIERRNAEILSQHKEDLQQGLKMVKNTQDRLPETIRRVKAACADIEKLREENKQTKILYSFRFNLPSICEETEFSAYRDFLNSEQEKLAMVLADEVALGDPTLRNPFDKLRLDRFKRPITSALEKVVTLQKDYSVGLEERQERYNERKTLLVKAINQAQAETLELGELFSTFKKYCERNHSFGKANGIGKAFLVYSEVYLPRQCHEKNYNLAALKEKQTAFIEEIKNILKDHTHMNASYFRVRNDSGVKQYLSDRIERLDDKFEELKSAVARKKAKRS